MRIPFTILPAPAATAAGGQAAERAAAMPERIPTGMINWLGSDCGVKNCFTRVLVKEDNEMVLSSNVPCNLFMK